MTKSNEDRLHFANDALFEKGNLDTAEHVFAADYVVHAGGKTHKGVNFVKRFVGQLRSAIPDLHVVEVKVLSQDGDTVTWQRTLSGTHSTEMMGIPPTGQRTEWRDMVVSRFEDGKIAEEWTVSELLGQLLVSKPSST